MCGSNQSKVKKEDHQMVAASKEHRKSHSTRPPDDPFTESKSKAAANDYGYIVKANLNLKPHIAYQLTTEQLTSVEGSKCFQTEKIPFSQPLIEVYKGLRVAVNADIPQNGKKCTFVSFVPAASSGDNAAQNFAPKSSSINTPLMESGIMFAIDNERRDDEVETNPAFFKEPTTTVENGLTQSHFDSLEWIFQEIPEDVLNGVGMARGTARTGGRNHPIKVGVTGKLKPDPGTVGGANQGAGEENQGQEGGSEPLVKEVTLKNDTGDRIPLQLNNGENGERDQTKGASSPTKGILTSKKVREPFKDSAFPPEKSSILPEKHTVHGAMALAPASKDMRLSFAMRYSDTFSWGTPLISSQDLQLFLPGTELTESVFQGALLNDYFLAVACAISQFEHRLKKLVVGDYPGKQDLEKMGFAINIRGFWRCILIDSYLPFYRKEVTGEDGTSKPTIKYLGAQCKTNQLWVCYLEKAYAKAMGGYFNVGFGGDPSQAFMDLTGAPTETKNLVDDFDDRDEAWEYIKKCYQLGFMMCCESTDNDSAVSSYPSEFARYKKEKMEKMGAVKGYFMKTGLGIVDQQTYTFMGLAQIDEERLIKLRNVWGRTEWLGAWSDGSPEWMEMHQKQLNHTHANDGLFFIPFRDFLKLFPKMYVCYYEDRNVTTCAEYDAGYEGFIHCFNLKVAKLGGYCVRVSQQSHCWYPLEKSKGELKYAPVTLLITKDNGIYSSVVAGKKECDRDVWIKANLSPGTYQVFVS